MKPHSSIRAWRVLWMEKPGGLLSMGSPSRIQLKQLSNSSIYRAGVGVAAGG